MAKAFIMGDNRGIDTSARSRHLTATITGQFVKVDYGSKFKRHRGPKILFWIDG